MRAQDINPCPLFGPGFVHAQFISSIEEQPERHRLGRRRGAALARCASGPCDLQAAVTHEVHDKEQIIREIGHDELTDPPDALDATAGQRADRWVKRLHDGRTGHAHRHNCVTLNLAGQILYQHLDEWKFGHPYLKSTQSTQSPQSSQSTSRTKRTETG